MKSVFLFNFIMMLLCISHLSKAQDSSSGDNPVNNCYTLHDVALTWNKAQEACRKMGAHLVTMETTKEWNKVKSFIAEKVTKSGSYTHWYIGLRKEGETWKWTEAGSPGVVVATDDSRWQTYEPSTWHVVEDCGEINADYQNQLGHFNNVQCNFDYGQIPRGYICENF